MCRIRPGIALAVALILGAASEAWGQQLVSGGDFNDRTAHNQFFHQGDTKQVERVFYSCVGGDLTLSKSPLSFAIPNTLNVSFVTSGHGTPTATWDPSAMTASLLADPPAGPSFNGTNQIDIPIKGDFLGPSFRFFLDNLWVTASGGPSTGNFTGTNRTDVSSCTVVDGCTATMPTNTIFPGTTVAAGSITISETSNVGREGIWQTAGADYGIRIQIPAGIGVTWDTSVTTIGNGGNGHVGTTVSYPDSRTVQITVGTSFFASESVTISGLQFVVAAAAADTEFHPVVLLGQSANTFAQCTVNVSTTGIFIKGVPTINSAANQVFTVGDPTTAIGDITIVDAQGTSKIPSGSTLKLIIPNSPTALNLEWDQTAIPTIVAGPIVVGAVTFTQDGLLRYKTMNIPITTNTVPGRTLVVQNAHFKNFAAPNPTGVAIQLQYDPLQPLLNDSKINVIGMPTITSASDQVFVVSQLPNPTLQTITIQDDATNPRIKNGVPLAIEIPAGLNLVFTGTVPTLSGNLGGAVTFTSGSPGNWKRINLTPTVDFGAGDSGTISNLEVSVGSTNSIGSLSLFMAPGSGTVCSTDPRILVIGSFPTMSSSATQQFTVNDPSTAINTVTISTNAGSAPLFQNGNSLQLVIPDTFFAEWNMSPASASLGGSAQTGGKVNVAGITYPLDGNGKRKILQLPITATWTAGDTLSFIGFEMTNFSATCVGPGTSLKLRVDVGGSTAATDSNAKSIGRPSITSSPPNQAFGQGDGSTLANKITIADDPSTPRILGGGEVRIRIPNGFPMTWDNTVVPAPVFTVGGSGTLGTFATAAQYYYTNPQGDQVLRIPVTGSFSPSQTFELSNVRFQNFASVHAATNLELEVNGAQGLANAFDTPHTVVIGTRPSISSITTQDQDFNGSIDHVIVTFDRPLDTASTSIATGAGFTVAGYPIVSGNLDPTHQIVTYTVLESGLADTNATPAVTYDSTVGSILEAANDLALKSTGVGALDKAAPVIVNFTTTDTDGNGHLDKMTFTFSENISGTPDISQWTVIDADGTTNLLAGLTNAAFQIQNGNQLVITFSNTVGTVGTPRFRYISSGVPGTLGDTAVPSPNLLATTTNNHPPFARPGQPQSLFPTVVTLDGSASSDPDGQPLTFAWSYVGFTPPTTGVLPPTPTVTLINPTLPVANAQLNTAGVYTFSLTVSDGLTSASATVAITILNVPPSAHAGPNQAVNLGNFAVLDGRLSTDPNGVADIQSYVWNLISGPTGATPLVNAVQNPASMIGVGYSPNVTGTYEFELAVTDRASNVSKNRCFVLCNPGSVPTAVAGPSQVVLVNQQATLDGTSSISAGGALTYLWTSTNNPADQVGPLDLLTVTTSKATFTPTGPGVYTFQLVVSNGVVSSIPDSISVLAYDPSNFPPTAVANLLLPIGAPVVGDTILLDATGSSDPEGASLKYAWTQTRGPLVTLTNATAVQPSFIAPVTGYYEFQLIVNDGVQSSFPVKTGFNVLLSSSSSAPTGSIASATSVVVGTAVPMTPSFTVSPTLWQWSQISGPSTNLTTWNNSWIPQLPTQVSALNPAPARPGVYRFQMWCWDGNQVLTILPVTVTVTSSATVVPTANGTASPAVTQVGQTVILDASGSNDGALGLGPGSRYVWSQVSGPPVALSNSGAVTPTFVPPAPGVYVFSLKVNDGTSDSPTELVVITVDAAAAASTGGGGGGGGGGCGLGVEQLLILPMLWTVAWFRRRPRR